MAQKLSTRIKRKYSPGDCQVYHFKDENGCLRKYTTILQPQAAEIVSISRGGIGQSIQERLNNVVIPLDQTLNCGTRNLQQKPTSNKVSCSQQSSRRNERLIWLKEPLYPKVFGFDVFGERIEEEKIPDEIRYAFRGENDEGHCLDVLQRYVIRKKRKRLLKNKKRAVIKTNESANTNNKSEVQETADTYLKKVSKNSTLVSSGDIETGDGRVRRKILRGSYDSDLVEEQKLPPLLRYTWKAKLVKLQKLLKNEKYRKEINMSDASGRTALHFAASWSCLRSLKILTAIPGIKVNERDEKGKTPIFKATEVYSYNCVKHLLESGANCNIGDMDNVTPLEYAVQTYGDDQLSLVQLLYQNTSRHSSGYNNMSLLHKTCLATPTVNRIVRMLIDDRMDVDGVEGSGRTPLILAVQTNKADIVQMLIDSKANVRHMDHSHKSASHYATPNSLIEKMLTKEVLKQTSRVVQYQQRRHRKRFDMLEGKVLVQRNNQLMGVNK